MRTVNIIEKYMLGVVLALGLFVAPRAASVLSAATELPLQAARDAYNPSAAFAKDNYVVVWQSGNVAPGSLLNGITYDGDIVGCLVSKTGAVLSTEPFVICGAAVSQEGPAAAAAKDTVLVVWQDLRNVKDWDVYGARVLANGQVLDPDGFLISGGAHNQSLPKVAWDGKTFVVVWQDFRNGQKYKIFAARVTTGGQVLDAAGISLPAAANASYLNDYGETYPVVASYGDERSFIYWSGGNRNVQGRGRQATALLLSNGIPGPVTYFINADDTNSQEGPDCQTTPNFIAAGSESFIVAHRTEVHGGRYNGPMSANAYIFNSQGIKAAKNLTIRGIAHRTLDCGIAFDGTAFVAVWSELRCENPNSIVDFLNGGGCNMPSEGIFVSRISTAGVLVDAAKELAGSSMNAPASHPSAASDGAGSTLVAYEQQPATADVPIKIGFRMLTAQ